MLAIVKRTEAELLSYFGAASAFAAGALRYDGDPLELESHQRAFLDDRSTFRWIVKARQVGFSFLFAIECLVRCHLEPNFTAICVSYNHADAVEKVRVARQLYEELPAPYRKRLVTDTRTELEFETNSGTRRGRSRIVSVPSKPPRGKHGTVYLDELAHYQDARKVYAGTTAAIARSKGQLTAASTPLGRRGLFWELCAEEIRAYPGHARQSVPWWVCTFFCRDVGRAVVEAPLLATEERVERFGTEALRHQFESLDLLEFQQEFEPSFIAERLSYFPYDLILGCTDGDLELAQDWSQVPAPSGRLVAGYEVGRRQHRSALALFEKREGRRFICRALKTYGDVPFEEQKVELRGMLETLPIARFSIDGNGLGMNLAEDLGRDFPQVVTESSSGPAKERWATDFKITLQRTAAELPRERGLVAEEANHAYFDNKGVPPRALLVSGGKIAPASAPRIERFVEEELKGRDNFHKLLIIEAEPFGNGDGARTHVDIKPLTGAQQQDALFQDYDSRNIDKVGSSFRVPALLRGDSKDFNRSVADAQLRFAEDQVFAPERDSFDHVMNRRILADLGILFWSFRSQTPVTRDPERLTVSIEKLVRVGVLTPEEGRSLAEDVFNTEFRKLPDDWVKKPITLTLAAIQNAGRMSEGDG